jgi:membrane protein
MIARRFRQWYRKLNRASGGRMDIAKDAIASFSEKRASQAAAGLAYYALFSLFPLLLVLIAGSSFFLQSEQAFALVARILQEALPVSGQLINENLRQIWAGRGTVGVLGLLALLWSASGFFTNLAYNINLAWPKASRRNFLANRLVGLGMIAGLILLLVLSLGLDGGARIVLRVDTFGPVQAGLWGLVSAAGSWLTIFLLFLALYRWVPAPSVDWRATAWSALAASIAWKAALAGFAWYTAMGLQQYRLIYGSLGAVVVLLLLIFVLSLVILFGAHLCAAIDKWRREARSKAAGV